MKCRFIFFLFFPSCLYAQSMISNPDFKDGIFGGLMIGANIVNGQWGGANTLIVINDIDTSLSASQTLALSGQTNSSSVAGRVFGGYQLVRANLLLAGELGGNFSQNATFIKQTTTSVFKSKLSHTPNANYSVSGSAATKATGLLSGNNLYLDIKSGLLIKPSFLLYARAGLSFLDKLTMTDNGSWEQQGTYDPAQPILPLYANGNSSQSNMKTGLRLGLGTEYLVTTQFGLLLDYTYTNYGKISTTTNGNQEFTGFDTNNNYQQVFGIDTPAITVATNTILLGVNYHF